MSEKLIKQKALAELKKEGYRAWCPVRPSFGYAEVDIFGVFDCIAIKKEKLRFIQWTTSININARIRKIEAFFNGKPKVYIPCEVWGWHNKKKVFIKKDL